MSRVVIIPGPEVVLWWGVEVPLLAAALGVVGVALGHLMAPTIGLPLPAHRQVAVVVGGMLVILTIAIAVGQRPWLVLPWGFGVGFSGVTIFRTFAAQTRTGMKSIGELIVDRLKRLGAGKDDGQ